MKIRQGFVSNSSSSSFCLVGVDDEEVIKEILKAVLTKNKLSGFDAYEAFDQGLARFGDFVFAGLPTFDDYETVDGFIGASSLFACGVEAESLLETKTLKKARELVKEKISKLGITLPDTVRVSLQFGEVSS